jgi:ribosome-binding factor A
MSFRKLSRSRLRALCTDLGPGDGSDPRLENNLQPRRVPNRKALQLCGQIERTLASVLTGECDDDVLRDLVVESVVPAPNASRVLVTVYLGTSAAEVPVPEVYEHLERARGRLRSEAAAAITRRRVPDLLFRLINRPGTAG